MIDSKSEVHTVVASDEVDYDDDDEIVWNPSRAITALDDAIAVSVLLYFIFSLTMMMMMMSRKSPAQRYLSLVLITVWSQLQKQFWPRPNFQNTWKLPMQKSTTEGALVKAELCYNGRNQLNHGQCVLENTELVIIWWHGTYIPQTSKLMFLQSILKL